MTAKALDLLPAAPPHDPLPARRVRSCRFESGQGDAVTVELPRPIVVASRRQLDAWLLRRAVEAGATHRAERVVEVDASATVRTSAGRKETFDVLVGADGAGSLVRRTVLGPLPKARLTMAGGYFARGDSEMVARLLPGLTGYLWLFPRPDHVGIGICAPLGSVPSRALLERLDAEVRRSFPALVDDEARRYAHTIPSPSTDPRSLAEIAGESWALVGDAAALADPITGEGIYYALRSAVLLAATLREGRPLSEYAERALQDFGRELLRAARMRDRFYRPGFGARMVRYTARSGALRAVLADLVLGDQGYTGLKRRLLRAGPRFLVDSALAGARLG